jgi:hypothetical protein
MGPKKVNLRFMGPILCIMGTKKIKFTYLGDKFTYPKAKKSYIFTYQGM